MKAYVRILFALILLSSHNVALPNILPTFNMTVKNIIISSNVYGGDSLIFFDIYCQHTNFGISDPFEYGSSQFAIWYNKALRQTGVLNAVKTGSDLPPGLQPPSLTVDTALGVIKSSGNAPSPGANYFVSPVFPGTKLLSVKFRTSQHKWPFYPFNFRFKLGAAPNTLIAYLQPYPGSVDSIEFPNQLAMILQDTINNIYSVEPGTPCSHCPPFYSMKVTVLFEGTYNEESNSQNRSDSVRLNIRNAVPPFDLVYSEKGKMDSATFSNTWQISNFTGGRYYIVISNSRCIETWSRAGGDTILNAPPVNHFSYDFTTSSSQAYGNNLKLKGSKYCIYSGDIDQDGVITLLDLLIVYNDASNYQTGNVISDLNGDNVVDLNDILIVYNNSTNFVVKITP